MATAVSEELGFAEDEKEQLIILRKEHEEIIDIFNDVALTDFENTSTTGETPLQKVEDARNKLEDIFEKLSSMEDHTGTLKNLTVKVDTLSKHIIAEFKKLESRRYLDYHLDIRKKQIKPMLRREKKFLSRLHILQANIGRLIKNADKALTQKKAIVFLNKLNKREAKITANLVQNRALLNTLIAGEKALLKVIELSQ
jgi:hypothetical protein